MRLRRKQTIVSKHIGFFLFFYLVQYSLGRERLIPLCISDWNWIFSRLLLYWKHVITTSERNPMKNYRFGFSLLGIFAVCLVMAPNLLSLLSPPPSNVLDSNEAKCWLWNLLENIGRFGLMISLFVIVNRCPPRKNLVLDSCALIALISYFVLWGFYFAGTFNGLLLTGMAVFPSIFFLLVSWKLRNSLAVSFSLLFSVTHVLIANHFLVWQTSSFFHPPME